MKIKATELQPGDMIWQTGFSRFGIGEGWWGPTVSDVEVENETVVYRTVNGGAAAYPAEQELEVADRWNWLAELEGT